MSGSDRWNRWRESVGQRDAERGVEGSSKDGELLGELGSFVEDGRTDMQIPRVSRRLPDGHGRGEKGKSVCEGEAWEE